MLWLDIESRSQCDLIKSGLARYARDLTTEVICISYAFDEGEVKTWFAEDEPFPQELIEYFNSGQTIYAQNASFERNMFDFVISNDYEFTPPKLEQWRCSSARAMSHGLPGSLGDICKALDLPLQKQKEGTRLIREYSAPGFSTEWKNNDKQLMQDYCEMDVLTMRQFCSVLRELSDEEWHQYHVTEKMNDNGVPIDIKFATSALLYSEEIKSDVDLRIRNHTEGSVPNARSRKLRDAWVLKRLDDKHKKLLEVKRKGEIKISFDQKHRENLLNSEDTPTEVRKMVELVEEAGGSAVAKYKSMVNTHVDNRCFGAMIWNGAGATGRYSSRGLQLQNFKRDVFDEPDELIQQINSKKSVASPSITLGRLTRSAIYTKKGLTFSDYSQIEARVLPWLADEPNSHKVLEAFKADRDIYIENACGMFDVEYDQVSKDDRQAAKTAVLACGFGGGVGALLAMASAYGISFSDDKAQEIVRRWRNANSWAQNLWYGLKEAMWAAVRHPCGVFHYKRIKFLFDGKDWLWMMLPSGRCLAYFSPRFEEVEYPWGDTGVEVTCLWGGSKPKVGEKWPRRTLNHLILAENATQATAADLMRETIVRVHEAGYKLLFSVHDELIIEGMHKENLTNLMTVSPQWAEGLPIEADTQEGERYGK